MAFAVDSCDLVTAPAPRPVQQASIPPQQQHQQSPQLHQQHLVRDAFRTSGLRATAVSPDQTRWNGAGIPSLGSLEATAHSALGVAAISPAQTLMPKDSKLALYASPGQGKAMALSPRGQFEAQALAAPAPSAGPHALGGVHKAVGFVLSTFDVALASEIVLYANRLREDRVQARLEKNGSASASMKDAIGVIVKSRNPEAFSAREAEEIVRRRRGLSSEHCLHQYGFLLHLAFYPITVLLALLVCVSKGGAALLRVNNQTPDASPMMAKPCMSLGRLLMMLITLCGLIPLSVILVALCAPADILMLLLRPILPAKSKRSATPWFFPSSLGFWAAGMGGYVLGLIAHRILGCSVLDTAFLTLNLGGELCKVQSQNAPPTVAFQAAVACDPHFLEQRHALRAMALRGIAEFYAPAGGPLAQMPPVVKWAYLLGDAELCAAWEAEALGRLPVVASSGASLVGLPRGAP